MASEILNLMFFEKPLDQFSLITPTQIPMGDEQNAACLNRWKSDGIGEVGITGNENASLGKGKDSLVLHPPLRMFGDCGDFVP